MSIYFFFILIKKLIKVNWYILKCKIKYNNNLTMWQNI